MKWIRKILLCTSVLVGILMIPIHGAESQGTTTVSYTPGRHYNQVVLTIDVHGSGTVYDGNQAIKEGTVEFTMLEEDQKILRIEADEGHEIKSVLSFNENETYEELTNEVVNQSLAIVMGKTDRKIEITFQEKGGDNQNENENNQNGNQNIGNGPSTGDRTNRKMISLFGGVSFLTMIMLTKRKKDKEKN